jgi:hypothetical protein
MRFTVDRERPRRSTADGSLQANGIDLSWLIGKPVELEHIDLSADGSKLRIREAVVNWAEQIATIRGEVNYTEDGPHIDAQLDSPGVVLDALLPPSPVRAIKERDCSTQFQAERDRRPWASVAAADHRSRCRALGFRSVRALSRRTGIRDADSSSGARAIGLARRAALRALAIRLSISATPGNLTCLCASTRTSKDLETAARCLSEERSAADGEFDLRADLSTSGQRSDWMRNLRGPVQLEAREWQKS